MKHVIALALLLAVGLCILAVTHETGDDAHDRRIEQQVDDFVESQP